MHSKRKIPDSWRTGWKAKACTSFALYLKVLKNHFYYLWHVRVLSIKPCLHTQLPAHNRNELLESFAGVGAFDHLEWTYNGAFEQLFGLGRGEFEQKCSKNSNAGGWQGGMFKPRFDWYIRWIKRTKEKRFTDCLHGLYYTGCGWISYRIGSIDRIDGVGLKKHTVNDLINAGGVY